MGIKVLHISTPDTWRGGEQQLAYLVQELAKHGVTQHVLCREGGLMADHCKKSAIPFTQQEKFRSWSTAWPKEVRKLKDSFGFDIIHTHDSHAHTAAVSSTFFGVREPIVVSRRVDFPIGKSPLSRWKYNHQRVKKVLCVSGAIEAIVKKDLSGKHRTKTVYSGIDLSRFSKVNRSVDGLGRFGIDSKYPVVGVVAALAPHKDLYTWLRAAKTLKQQRSELQFIIFGEGPERLNLEKFRAEIGMNEVVFAGFQSDIPSLLPNLDVFMFSSETEGLGTSILDAFACRVPVVATRAGGVPELVINEQTGLSVEVRNFEALAKQVLRVLDDAELAENLVQKATKHLESFTYQTTAYSTLEVYREVLQIRE